MKIIDYQIKDENRYNSGSKPKYVASIRLKIDGVYTGVEDLPLPEDFRPGSEEHHRAALEALLAHLHRSMVRLHSQVHGNLDTVGQYAPAGPQGE